MNQTTTTLNRVDPRSTGKMFGFLYGALGLLIGIGFAIATAAIPPGQNNQLPRVFQVAFGIGAIVFMPAIYGLMGFLSAMIMAIGYNWLAGKIGGIQWTLQISSAAASEITASENAPPPLPE